MTESRVVYAVPSGDYDVCNHHGVFERREDAEAAVAAGFGGFLETQRLHPAGFVPQRIDYWTAGAHVSAQGSLLTPGVQVLPAVEWTGGEFMAPVEPRVSTSPSTLGRTYVSALAMTEDVARQACSDAVAQLCAEATKSTRWRGGE